MTVDSCDTPLRQPLGVTARFYTKTLTEAIPTERLARLKELAGFRAADGTVVFRCVGYHDAGGNSLTMEHIDGEPARHALARSTRLLMPDKDAAIRAIDAAGRWLGYFHRWQSTGPLEPYDTEARLERCLSDLGFLQDYGLSTVDADAVTRALEKTRRREPLDLLATVHGDFKAGNLMLLPGEVVGIDMEGYHHGHPLVDLGQFVAHLFLTRSDSFLNIGSAARWGHLARRFLGGYKAVAGWDLAGLEFRLLDASLGVLSNLMRRHPGLFWQVRGRTLTVRTIRCLLRMMAEGAFDL